MSLTSQNTELTNLEKFNVENLVKDIKIDKDKNSTRILLSVRNPKTNKLGDLIFQVPGSLENPPPNPQHSVFSFGLKKSIVFGSKDNEPKGYEVTLVLGTKKNDEVVYSPEETVFMNKMKEIIDHLKQWIVKKRVELKKPTFKEANCETLDKVFYFKLDERGEPKPDCCPTFTTKAVCYKKTQDANGQKIEWDKQTFDMKTKFYESDQEDLSKATKVANFEDYIRTYTHCKAVVKLESIYMAAGGPYLQIKLIQCVWAKKGATIENFLTGLVNDSSEQSVATYENMEKVKSDVEKTEAANLTQDDFKITNDVGNIKIEDPTEDELVMSDDEDDHQHTDAATDEPEDVSEKIEIPKASKPKRKTATKN